MVDVLIHQFTHMEFSNGTLPILLNFWKTIWLQKTWLKLNQVQRQNCFSKVKENRQSPIRKSHVGKLMNQNVDSIGIF